MGNRGTSMEAGTVPEKVSISHRGAKYEIGRGKRYYGIWVAGAPESDPLDRWPETREGWEQAWGRFVAIEKPETIVPVTKTPRAGFKLPKMTAPAALRPSESVSTRNLTPYCVLTWQAAAASTAAKSATWGPGRRVM